MRKYFFILCCLAFASCYMTEEIAEGEEMIPPGKILVKQDNDSCYLLDSGQSRFLFTLPDTGAIKYSGLAWMNKTDDLICIEYHGTPYTGTTRTNIVRMDTSGNVVERLYESQHGEIAWFGYLSRNDEKILFTTQWDRDDEKPLEGLHRELTLMVMDFKTRTIVKKISSIGYNMSFELSELTWVDENRFIYTIIGGREIHLVGEGQINKDDTQPGVYLYDLTTDKKTLLAPGAEEGICSPTDTRIAYAKDGVVSVLNLEDNSTKEIFAKRGKINIKRMHWTPDGKYIYVFYGHTDGYRNILVEANTGTVFMVKDILTSYDYSWK